jgi:hypothetical protein
MTIASSSKDTVYSAQNNLESEIDDYMSFSRQIETLKRGNTNVESQESTQALSIPTVATPSSRPKYIHCRIHQSERLDRLLQLFMEEGDFYYPVIFGCNFKNRLDTLLREHRNKNGDGLSLPVDRVDLVSLAALACMVIACAETIDINTLELPKVQRRDGTSVTDQDTWRLEGRHLLESSNWQRSVNLDMVRFHLVEALFLLMCERLRESYHAMVTTASLALVTNLNNQDNWFANSEDERISKRVLWWTVYLMDRQVGHKCGKPYLIRDAEFVVDDFEDLLADSASKPTVDPSLLNEHLQFNCTYNTEWYRYLQFLAQWSQNFTKVWDALFSIRAARVTNEDQLELIDALILKLNRNLGPGLDWKPNMLPDLTAAPTQDLEHEQNLRLRLIIFTVRPTLLNVTAHVPFHYSPCRFQAKFLTPFGHSKLIIAQRFNLLRLLLHHKRFLLCLENQASVSHKREDCAFSFTVCQSLSIDTIDALAAVTVGRRIINPLGTFITMAIIECIYHLRILEQKSFQDHNSSIQYDPTIRKGIDCLRAMSASGVNMARNAIRELEGGQSKHAAAAGQAFERASPLENFGAMENDHDIQRWDGLDLNFPLLYPDWDFIN